MTKWNNWNWKLFLPRNLWKKSCSKKLNKYVATFGYIDKILIILSATSSGVSIISFTSIIGAPTKFRLSEIIGIENYFYQEINQRKSCSKKLNKYVITFDYIDKILYFKCNK